MSSLRMVVADDGREGALVDMLKDHTGRPLALVSSPRPRPGGLRRGVWVSHAPLRQLIPRQGQVVLRATSAPDWTPEAVDAEAVLALLSPSADADELFFVAALLGLELPASMAAEVNARVQAWKAEQPPIRRGTRLAG